MFSWLLQSRTSHTLLHKESVSGKYYALSNFLPPLLMLSSPIAPPRTLILLDRYQHPLPHQHIHHKLALVASLQVLQDSLAVVDMYMRCVSFLYTQNIALVT